MKEKVVAQLEKIVGAEHVTTSRPDLYSYSQDVTENEPSWPDFVVMPGNVEEVQEVLRLANREKVFVIPYTGGNNVGGLTIPLKGGIVLDLTRMNRLIEFNEEDRYIIVEPGFNFGDLRRLLDKKYPHLWYSFPGSPADCSVMSNALTLGFGRLTNVVGTNADNINGIEVVLPTGEVAKIGSCSVTPNWSNRSALPDLVGLFLGWQGATGVVTKIAVQLWPRHPLKRIKLFIIDGIRPTCRLVRKLGQTMVCEIVSARPFEEAQLSADKTMELQRTADGRLSIATEDKRTSGTYDRPPGPDMHEVIIEVAADTEDELKCRLELLDVIVKEEMKDTQFKELRGELAPVAESPLLATGRDVTESQLPARGRATAGGLTWIGTMGPTSCWSEGLEKLYAVCDKYRLRRDIPITPFRGGHYGMLRALIEFNKGDPDEVERVKKCVREMLVVALDVGFTPYKAPYWAVEEMMRRGDPNWAKLLIRVKKMLDPNNIMNPGRWGDTKAVQKVRSGG
jgi:FAD/FMN-containing dehydrogenase